MVASVSNALPVVSFCGCFFYSQSEKTFRNSSLELKCRSSFFWKIYRELSDMS